MDKFLIILFSLLLVACSSSRPAIKFVNPTIAPERSEQVFSTDHKDCSKNSTKNRPLIYEKCRVYNFSAAKQKQCNNENKYKLAAYKKLTKKLYKRCLEKKGWKEEQITTEISKSVKIHKNQTYTHSREDATIPLCIGCMPL